MVVGVATQGASNKWVTFYKIKYSETLRIPLQTYQEGGADKVILMCLFQF